MDHSSPEGSHELHIQEPDCRITEMELVTPRWWKDWQHNRKRDCMTDTLQLAPAAWPHSNNTGMNTNLAQASAREITLSKRVRDQCGGGPILWCNVLKDHRPDITGHCHLCSLSFDSETQKERVALHLINNQSPPLSPDAGRLQTDKWQRGRRPPLGAQRWL